MKKYRLIYEVAGKKINIGNFKTRETAYKKMELEKQKDNFGLNGFNEYITIKYK